MIENRTKWYAK